MPEEVSQALRQAGLKREAINLVSPDGGVEWIQGSLATRSRQSMTWYTVEKLTGQGNGKG